MADADAVVVWDPAMLGYDFDKDFGEHAMRPERLELTIELARALGVLTRPNVTVLAPKPATDDLLGLIHSADYLDAVRLAEADPAYGLGTTDNPVFDNMHEISALITGGSVAAAEAVWRGEALRAANIAGGLHHAMRGHASGFCVYNDPAVAIARLLDLGAERVAYIDVDVHHGDGVQAAFYDDPRVLTASIHETPLALFPGSGFPYEVGARGAEGMSVNIALPPGTDDTGWLRAFHAVIPGVVRAFAPQILLAQCGCDSHARDPLADLMLSVEGQRAAHLAIKNLTDELCDGRWVAFGGGGYGIADVVPLTWTHLLATLTGEPLSPRTATPNAWRTLAAARCPGRPIPTFLGDGAQPDWQPWQPGGEDSVDRAIHATRTAVYPLHGLDPDDPRD